MSTSRRAQTVGEEVANSITHGIGFGLAVAALVLLIIWGVNAGTTYHVVSASIFGSSLVTLYLSSTLYHALARTRAKRVFQVLDHSFIFILIAGTYTPFTLVNLRGPWGWSLFGVVWGLAVGGIVLKAILLPRYDKSTSAIYVVMGWLICIALHKVIGSVPPLGIKWLVAGGLCYTAGVVFFALDHKFHFAHTIWHLFVLAGSICHFFAVKFGVMESGG